MGFFSGIIDYFNRPPSYSDMERYAQTCLSAYRTSNDPLGAKLANEAEKELLPLLEVIAREKDRESQTRICRDMLVYFAMTVGKFESFMEIRDDDVRSGFQAIMLADLLGPEIDASPARCGLEHVKHDILVDCLLKIHERWYRGHSDMKATLSELKKLAGGLAVMHYWTEVRAWAKQRVESPLVEEIDRLQADIAEVVENSCRKLDACVAAVVEGRDTETYLNDAKGAFLEVEVVLAKLKKP